MPELPEVETIRIQLEKYIVEHKVKRVEARYKNFEGNGRHLEGGKVEGIRRFGKVLVIDLSNGYSAVIHIKLTGQLIYRGPNLLKAESLSPKVSGGLGGKHTHVIFHLDKNGILYYNDVMKFGWIKIVKTKDVEKVGFIEKLGPEPFKGLSFKVFKDMISKSSRAIKVLLMDQTKIGGVGNIYSNDTLWLAKITPRRPANSLSLTEQSRSYDSILEVLKKGLKRGGASELAFVTPDGSEGEYQKHFLAYGRKDEPCERCRKAKFKKINLGGRGTYYCPYCQK